MHISRVVVVVVAVATALGAPALHAEPDAAWVARMNGLAAALAQLLPDALDDKPIDKDRAERMRKNAAALRQVAHDLAMVKSPDLPDGDPTLPMLLAELDHATADVRPDKSPDRLRDLSLLVAATCIGCHTRTDRGLARPRATLAPVDKALPGDVRADILAATRRFTEARAAYKAVVFDEEFAKAEPFRWERAVKRALVLEVRVARDPKGAASIVEQVLATPSGEPLWEDAAQWKRSISHWTKDARPRPSTVDGMYAEAQRLMDEADTIKRAPADESADVTYLRATGTIHEMLGMSPKREVRAQGLQWLGVAYDALADLDPWSLTLVYDAACVEAAPHSELARECLGRFEDKAKVQNLGNAGGELPDEIKARLAKLRALAAPLAPDKPDKAPEKGPEKAPDKAPSSK